MEEQVKPVKKRPVALIVIIGIAGLGVIIAFIYYQLGTKMMDYNYNLYIVAKTQNLIYPSTLTDGVRVDSVAAKFDKQYWTYVTMTETTIEETDLKDFCELSEGNLLENLAAGEAMSEFAENNVIVGYEIRDKNGELMCSVVLPPEKYYKKPLL